MRKIILFLLLMIFVPINVLAMSEGPNTDENENLNNLPRDGVTYFLEYPNGMEDVIENYDELVNNSEKTRVLVDYFGQLYNSINLGGDISEQ